MKIIEGMSLNYDNSFPRQNVAETLDTAGSREAGLEMTTDFAFTTGYPEALNHARLFIEEVLNGGGYR